MSKKKRSRKVRKRSINIEASKTLTIGPNQQIFAVYKDGNAYLADENGVPYDTGLQSMVKTYQGQNKERVIAKATNLNPTIDRVLSWPDNFDYLFAIDTNTHTEKYDNCYYSVAAAYSAKVTKVSEHERLFNCRLHMIIEWFYTQYVKIEPYSWRELILELSKTIPTDKKVGIVVDSELGNHDEYNNRTIPICGEWYLPENYSLIYATANVTDEWCNRMIIQCDKTATAIMEENYKAHRISFNLKDYPIQIANISLIDH